MSEFDVYYREIGLMGLLKDARYREELTIIGKIGSLEKDRNILQERSIQYKKHRFTPKNRMGADDVRQLLTKYHFINGDKNNGNWLYEDQGIIYFYLETKFNGRYELSFKPEGI